MKTYQKPETAVADFLISKTVLMTSGVTPGSIGTKVYTGGDITIL